MIYSVYPWPDEKYLPEELFMDVYGNAALKRNLVALEGHCMIRSEAAPNVFAKNSKPYQSRIMCNPTWDKLFKCAKNQQRRTRDFHHNYFEDFIVTHHEIIKNKKVFILKLLIGS